MHEHDGACYHWVLWAVLGIGWGVGAVLIAFGLAAVGRALGW